MLSASLNKTFLSLSLITKTDKTARVLNKIETNKVNKECYLIRQPKTDKNASILNKIETNKVNKECYLIRQPKTDKNASILN